LILHYIRLRRWGYLILSGFMAVFVMFAAGLGVMRLADLPYNPPYPCTKQVHII